MNLVCALAGPLPGPHPATQAAALCLCLCTAGGALAQEAGLPARAADEFPADTPMNRPVHALRSEPLNEPLDARVNAPVNVPVNAAVQSGYSSAAAAEIAARYRTPRLSSSGSAALAPRTPLALWRDTTAPTRSRWQLGLAPSLPAPQMVGGPPPAAPHVELALTARVERLDRSFKPSSGAEGWKELGTFRLQMGTGNELALKPRRGGASLSWRSRF